MKKNTKKKTRETCKVDKNTQMRIMFYYPPASPSILSYDTKILQFSQKHFQQKKDLSKYPARKCECKNKLKEQGGEQETGKS